MLSSPYYAKSYASKIDTSQVTSCGLAINLNTVDYG